MSKSEVNGSNFRKKVAAVIRSGKSIRGNIQELFQYAAVRYLNPESNGDLSDMTYLFQQVASVKSLNHNTLGQFCEDTLNIKLAKTQDGTPVFRKAVKGEAPAIRDDGDMSANWWEHGRAPTDSPVDVLKTLSAAVKKLESTQGDTPKKALVPGQECVVTSALNALTGAIARAEMLIAEHDRAVDCTDELEEAA